jgi:hypothetical protein
MDYITKTLFKLFCSKFNYPPFKMKKKKPTQIALLVSRDPIIPVVRDLSHHLKKKKKKQKDSPSKISTRKIK